MNKELRLCFKGNNFESKLMGTLWHSVCAAVCSMHMQHMCGVCLCVCVVGWMENLSSIIVAHTQHTHTAKVNEAHTFNLPLSWTFRIAFCCHSHPSGVFFNKNTKKTKKKIHRPTASHEHRAQHKAHNQDAESNIIVFSCLKLPFASMWIMCEIENNVCAHGMRVPLCTHI